MGYLLGKDILPELGRQLHGAIQIVVGQKAHKFLAAVAGDPIGRPLARIAMPEFGIGKTLV